MGHRDKTVKLGRTSSHRYAMLSNMVMSLFEHRVIRTTDAKAKALKPLIDRLIVTAKRNDLTAKRLVARTIHKKNIFKKLFGEIVPQFEGRSSGFSRVIKLGVRRGDGAAISVVELLVEKPVEVEDTKEKGKKGKATAKAKTKQAAPAKSKRAGKTKEAAR
jgi:large subunit ribosomal protein L17